MNIETGDSIPYTLPRYTRQWVYTFLALAVAFTWYFKIQHPLAPKLPAGSNAAPVAQESYWFFALQLPNPKPGYSPEEFHRKSSDWFNALRQSGFHPMLYSEVRARLSKGMLLPEKTIVLSIDEALLTTYEAYEPLLKTFKFPAVLTTSQKPLREGDRGYLSSNAVQKLPLTGAWDVILIDDLAPPKLFTPQEILMTLPMPPKVWPWSSGADRSLANQLADLRRPRRLGIDWRWSGQDLIHRLQAETPVHSSGSRLGAKRIMDRQWGVVLSKETNSDDRFSLHAPADQRFTDIGWLGTRGLENFQIDFSVEDLTGELWFLLRSSGGQSDRLKVGFFDGKVTIKEEIAGHEHLRGMTDWPLVFPWKGTIQVTGSELRVLHQDETIMVTRVNHRRVHHSESILQLVVYDQLFGAAQARDISLRVMPLLSEETIEGEGAL